MIYFCFFAIFLIGNYIYKRLPMTVWLSLCKLYLDFVNVCYSSLWPYSRITHL